MGSQNDILKALCDWLGLLKSLFDWLRASSIKHHFKKPSSVCGRLIRVHMQPHFVNFFAN